MERKTRVRFAPSPTGPLHMGGVRTALYNYLYAKQRGGDFIIRIEDTDSQRFVPGAEKYIIDSLNWCGIIADEGVDKDGNVVETPSERHPHAPYRQSQRKDIYRKYAEQLVEGGFAYYAFDTAEELSALRAEAEARKETFIYNHATRSSLKNSLTLPEEEWKRRIREESGWTIRFKMPEDRIVKMDDLIRGHVEVNSGILDDKVLWKSADQLPTYHLANIVDDHLMEITEVIRGEEWLPSLPLHYLLYEAFGWTDTMPRFAHLSLLLKPDGKGKLSKRDGDRLGFPVFPLQWVNEAGEITRGYREDGYLPEAFVNMLAMLGWNPGDDREMFTMDELVKAFSLERVIKSGARFNPDKAKWYNREYLRLTADGDLVGEFRKILEDKGVPPEKADDAYLLKVIGLIKERATFVKDFWDIAHYLFIAPSSFNEADAKKFWKPENVVLAKQAGEFIAACEPFEKEHLEESLTGYIKGNEWPMGKVMNTLRLCLIGSSSGLGIADVVTLIGKEETAARISFACKTLGE